MVLTSRLRRSATSQPFGGICLQCFRKLYGVPLRSKRSLSSTRCTKEAIAGIQLKTATLRREYFSANDILRRVLAETRNTAHAKALTEDSSTAKTITSVDLSQNTSTNSGSGPRRIAEDLGELPHRRRKRQKQEQRDIPPDASSQLSTLSSTLPSCSFRRRLAAYLALSKPRLSFLIVLTTTASYAIYPMPAILLSSATSVPSLSPLILLFLTTGTALACSSANALNMLYEPDSDSKMSRTRNRPLVRGLIPKRGALIFAILTGAIGCGGLYYGVNPTVAALGFANIVLYAGLYTPLKRLSVLNTWAGALVGAIPPLMGWAAAAGQYASSYRSMEGMLADPGWKELLFAQDGSSVGGWLLAALLFAWQFPHFNALSHTIREEYRAAGMRMLCWVSPRANARIAFRYSLYMFPICLALSSCGVTDWSFVATSGLVNTWMAAEAWKFWRRTGEHGSARGLFWASVWHLPIVLVLAMAHKKGLWERVWGAVWGEAQEEDDAEDEHEDERNGDEWRVAGVGRSAET